MKRRTYFFLSGCLLFKYLHFLKNKNNIKTTYNSYTLGHNQEKYAAETIQGLQLKTMQGYINTAATQLYSIFCSLFFSFLFLYTTRKGWFIFLACLKNCLQKKKGLQKRGQTRFRGWAHDIHNREDEGAQTNNSSSPGLVLLARMCGTHVQKKAADDNTSVLSYLPLSKKAKKYC